MKRAAALLVITLLLQLAVGADYFWIPNSNWDEPGNWALKRPPCGGEVASFAATPAGSLIYLNSDVTVGSILLPRNGKIVLKPSVTIRFSNDASCTIDNTDPLVADVKDGQEDVFTGVQDNLWECPENWLQADKLPADHPPCRGDNAIFERDSAYSFVTSKSEITVNSLTVRGVELKSLNTLADPSLEFKLKVVIEPRCADNPSLCPCPSQDSCETSLAPQKGSSKAALAAGISVGILVIVAITVAIVVIVVIMYVRRRHGSYTRDDLMEPDEKIVYKSERSKASSDAVAFDNPLYDATTGKVHLVGYEVKGEPIKQQPGEEAAKSSSSGKKFMKQEDLKPILDYPDWETS